MKYLILFCMGTCSAAFANAQNPRYDVNKNGAVAPVPNPDKLKLTLSNDTLFIIYKNHEVPSASIRVLDSLMKVIPAKERLTVEFSTLNSNDETVQSINTILNRCQCPTVRSRMSFPKQEP